MGLQTGISGLDKALLGLHGITTIQGEPKACKSTLCLQIAGNAAKAGHPVLMVDRENGLQRIRLRLTCQAKRKSQADILAATEAELAVWTKDVQQLPVFVLTAAPHSTEQILSYVRSLWKEYRKPVLIVVDSLQAMPRLPGDKDGRVSIEHWMGFFDQVKVTADGLVYVLMTSEKRRGGYDDATLDGGKGSNAIEYKSEVLLDLRRDKNSGTIILECKAFRDGLADFRIDFEKVMAEASNPQSFCYLLREVERI